MPDIPTAASKGGRPRKVVVLSPQDVSAATSLSRRQVQDLVADGSFPSPVRLSERRIGWYEHEVTEWLMARPRSGFAKRKSVGVAAEAA